MVSVKKQCEYCGKDFIARFRGDRNSYEKLCSVSCYRLRGHSDETRRKLSMFMRANPMRYWQGKNRSQDTKNKISKNRKGKMIGEDNHFYGKKPFGEAETHVAWVGGTWKYWRTKALKRDDYTCQKCGYKDIRIMEVDHIVELKGENRNDPNNNTLENLQTLCPNCHRLKTNGYE